MFLEIEKGKIASSMLKIHNGHYIVAASNEYVGLVTSLLSSIPWEMGYMLERRKKSLNVALEKLPGVRHILRIRTTHLFEADFKTYFFQIARCITH